MIFISLFMKKNIEPENLLKEVLKRLEMKIAIIGSGFSGFSAAAYTTKKWK